MEVVPANARPMAGRGMDTPAHPFFRQSTTTSHRLFSKRSRRRSSCRQEDDETSVLGATWQSDQFNQKQRCARMLRTAAWADIVNDDGVGSLGKQDAKALNAQP